MRERRAESEADGVDAADDGPTDAEAVGLLRADAVLRVRAGAHYYCRYGQLSRGDGVRRSVPLCLLGLLTLSTRRERRNALALPLSGRPRGFGAPSRANHFHLDEGLVRGPSTAGGRGPSRAGGARRAQRPRAPQRAARGAYAQLRAWAAQARAAPFCSPRGFIGHSSARFRSFAEIFAAK